MNKRPKIGLALSGASGRAMAHAGVLEVLHEQGIPIDYIAACSSGTIIAAAYACGTLKDFKADFIDTLTRTQFLGFIKGSESGAGLFSLDKARAHIIKYTKGLNIEDVKPQLGFVTVDLHTGQEEVISMGDIAKGVVASCSVPGLFEPVVWGNKMLADGGLVNIVPADVVKRMGADVVISVDIAASRYIFTDREINILKGLGWFFRTVGFPLWFIKKLIHFLRRWLPIGNFMQIYSQSDVLNKSEEMPDLLKIMSKVVEISLRRKNQGDVQNFLAFTDVLIEPPIKHHGRTEFSNLRAAYLEGRKTTLNAVPQILKLMQDYETGKLTPRPVQAPLPLRPNI